MSHKAAAAHYSGYAFQLLVAHRPLRGKEAVYTPVMGSNSLPEIREYSDLFRGAGYLVRAINAEKKETITL